MAIQTNQLEIPFTSADKSKLDTVQSAAEVNPPIASQVVAEAGVDNLSYMTALRTAQAIAALAPGGSSSVVPTLGETLANQSGSDLGALVGVGIGTNGYIELIDVSDETSTYTFRGVTAVAITDTSSGLVVTAGRIENVTTGFALRDRLYIAKDGTITNVPPEIGQDGFAAGDWILYVGCVVVNQSNGSNKDFFLKPEIIGQL